MSVDGLDQAVAILGMAGRFPGAPDLETLWGNLRNGVESVRRFSREELLQAGQAPELVDDPRFVPAGAPLDDVDRFDADFFRFNPREAAFLDPQHRLFLECAWEAMEDAGYDPARSGGPVGVFAGCYASNYLLFHLAPNPALMASVGHLSARILNDKDFLPTRVSYLMGLRGPSVCVQSACSTSLAALHLACRSLLSYECDMALAGGVALSSLEPAGYLHQEGGIFSPDGHCRAFDKEAAGTVPGSGLGVVVLKRLVEALEDGDRIRAVVRGSAMNNDGDLKVGFTAPSGDAQAEVIATALDFAEVDPATVTYVEAHGTGTELGDPIEVDALRRAFADRGRCALGSVKSNFGHLDAAAGVAGVIKTVLALENGTIPPSLHFREPGPEMDLGPFHVAAEALEWKRGPQPRRAGVSSFGVGGTNVHVVLEEAPEGVVSTPPRRPAQLLLLSARSPVALERSTDALAAHLAALPDTSDSGSSDSGTCLADVAHTLQVGRHRFAHRSALVARDLPGAASALAERRGMVEGVHQEGEPSVVFLLPGQGAQYPGMARDLYHHEPVFRRELDRCLDGLRGAMDADPGTLLFPADDSTAEAARALRDTAVAQPVLFAVSWSLARLWESWGVRPAAMVGHSVGELVAAALAGVFTLPAALELVAARGRLVAETPPGAMLALPLGEERAAKLAGGEVALAAVNAPDLCVLSGPREALDNLRRRLGVQGIEGRWLQTSHAFHSPTLEPVLGRFREAVVRAAPSAPERPFVSTLTGRQASAEEVATADYWVRQLRHTVRFADAVNTVAAEPGAVYLEVGPGDVLVRLVGRCLPSPPPSRAASLRHASDSGASGSGGDVDSLLAAAGALWCAGVELDWAAFQGEGRRRRVALPTYPFQRQRYWVDRASPTAATGDAGLEALDVPRSEADAAADGGPFLSPAEARVADLWEEMLGVRPRDPGDDFFALGGHSLLAVQMLARLSDGPGGPSLEGMLEDPTLGGVARRLEGADSGATLDLRPVERRPGDETPLSVNQHGVWLHDQVTSERGMNNVGAAFRVEGPLDRGSLAAAFSAIVARHRVLSSSFPAPGGEPVQRLEELPAARPLILDLAALPEERRELELRRQAARLAHLPFDLLRPPLLRLGVFRLDTDVHVLLLGLHHIVGDGWSLGVLIRQLSELYAASPQERREASAPAPVQYSDFASWQQRWLEGEEAAEHLAFWRRELAGAPPFVDLPTDRPREAVQGFRGTRALLDLPADLEEGLERVARDRRVTPFVVLLAAYHGLVHHLSGAADVVVGVPELGRDDPRLAELVGCFINALPVRVDLSGGPTLGELVERTAERFRRAHSHRRFPFERLVEELAPPRSTDRQPLFQVVFNHYDDPTPRLRPRDLEVRGYDVLPEAAKYDMTFYVGKPEGRLRVSLVYNASLFAEATAERWLRDYEGLLRQVVDDPDRTLGETLRHVAETEAARRRRQAEEGRASRRQSLRGFRRGQPVSN